MPDSRTAPPPSHGGSVTVHLPASSAQDRSYPLFFNPLAEVPALMEATGFRPGRCLIVTDENVGSLYAGPLVEALHARGWTPYTIVVPPGEPSKQLPTLGLLYNQALAQVPDRSTPVLALGGGVVGDLAGFAAATLLRGLPLVQLPTTLIAQVDSAIGGKTGINHAEGKNLIGAFHQPRFVCADPSTLHSLPDREWTSGLAEVVKHALIADAPAFDFLQTHWQEILDRDPSIIREMVPHSASIKARVVSEDERESGKRAILNFGHTFGHAIENATGYGTFTHGEAIALGMTAALHLSQALHPAADFDRALALVGQLPVEGSLDGTSIDDLISAMQSDKKRTADALRFVVLDRIGHAYVTADVTRRQLIAAWEALDLS